MTTVAAPPVRVRTTRSLLPAGWPLYALFGLYPVWWFLGIGAFLWPIMAVILAVGFVLRGERLRAPRGFGIWILFLLWILGSSLMVEDPTSLIVWGYRVSLYFSGTALFLYIYNQPSWRMPAKNVLRALMAFWMLVVVGGFLGMAFPEASFHSPMEAVMPGGLLSNEWFHDLIHVSFAQVQSFLGYDLSRPSAPFAYTNEWGSALALLTPLVLAALATRTGRRLRLPIGLMMAAAVIPIVMSVNRGLWLSLGLGLAYAWYRLLGRGRVKGVAALGMIFLVVAVAIVVSPLGGVITDRLENPHSNEGRLTLYKEATDSVAGSPLIGYGVPRQSETQRTGPPVGTHGLIWMILVSHGIPAVLFFLGWFLWSLWATRRVPTSTAFWANVTIFIALVQLAYYGMLPSQFQVLMVAAALAWRDRSELQAARA
ncbi:MAG: hypothetical protein M3135_00910 [Actinomycetota bacterium]|nr:hypothetical protein [Actinomycetota bacterium]